MESSVIHWIIKRHEVVFADFLHNLYRGFKPSGSPLNRIELDYPKMVIQLKLLMSMLSLLNHG